LIGVGDSVGFGIITCLEKYREALKGKMVLEDCKELVNSIESRSFSRRMGIMAHNFFTWQPVQGKSLTFVPFTLIYPSSRFAIIAFVVDSSSNIFTPRAPTYLHSILHDHLDPAVFTALLHIADAISESVLSKPSRLII
jgi:hypothetical protein